MAHRHEIERNIVNESHRVGWPSLRPIPWRGTYGIENLDEFGKEMSKCAQLFKEVLISHSVEYSSVDVVNWRTRRGWQPPTQTLVVFARHKKSSWVNAVVSLVETIQTLPASSGQQFAVEITEEHYPTFQPIPAGDPVLSVWETVLAPRVMESLDQNTMVWQGIALNRVGGFFNEPTTAITIESPAADQGDWKPVCSKIQAEIKSLFPADIDVVVSQAQSTTSSTIITDKTNLWHRMWSGPMQVGDGIAPVGEETTGTLGGFIELSSNSTTVPLMLTNFHVVKEDKLISALSSDSDSVPLRSMCFTNNPSPYPVNVPAQLDSNNMLEMIDAAISGYNEVIYSEDSGNLSLKKRAKYSSAARSSLKGQEKLLAQCEDRKSDVESTMAQCAGSVMATSGYQSHSKDGRPFAMDWAILNIDGDRDFARGRLPSRVDQVYISQGELPAWTHQVPSTAQKYTAFTKNFDVEADPVVKLGRMTGWTQGAINNAPTFWKQLVKDDPKVADWNDRYGPVTTCIQVNRYSKSALKSGGPVLHDFAMTGDSGAIVRDEKTGTWLGLLFESHPIYGWALMTPIDVVFKSIEEVTGGKVVYPTYHQMG